MPLYTKAGTGNTRSSEARLYFPCLISSVNLILPLLDFLEKLYPVFDSQLPVNV